MRRLQRYLAGILAGDDDLDRACQSLPDDACREEKYNFRANVGNGAASKLAEQVAGPNLILPWLFQLLGTPVWMFGFLMPIKQSFSLLPQMVVAGQIRRLPRRKWVWVSSGIFQAACLLLMIPVALWLPPLAAGLILLLLLVLFSMASGTASVAFQDVLGKTIDKGRRGQLLARRAFIGGLLTTLAGILLNRWRSGQQELLPVLWLLAIAAGLWLLAAASFALIREAPGAVYGGRNALAEISEGRRLFSEQPGFRRFLLVRSLLLAIEMATPFFVLHAAQTLPLGMQGIGSMVIAIGLSQVISSPFWGRLADRTSRQVMALSALLGLAAVLLALLLGWIEIVSIQYSGYFLAFVLIGLAEAGVRLGRKTYLVDATPQDERATYTAFSNSLIGILALLSGVSGVIAQALGPVPMLIIIALISGSAALVCRRLPEAGRMLTE